MLTGTVFDIQRFSLHDGPGVRTTVFLKGCPLKCMWCHNPEGLSKKPQLRYNSSACIGCLDCTALCSCHGDANGRHFFSREKCTVCGRCADACPAGAMELVGREMTVDQVMEKVLADKKYYGETGGITVSGGEPLFQSDFTEALLRRAKEENIHTAIETSGYCTEAVFSKIAPLCDLLLMDYKIRDEEAHLRYTGVSSEPIRKNYALAARLGVPVILRCPIIPGVNDNEHHLQGIARAAASISTVREIHIEPYHTLGLTKTAPLGMESKFSAEPLPVSEAQKLCEMLKNLTPVKVRISK